MRLYRGIAVPALQLEAVIFDIRSNDILGGSKTRWNTWQEGHLPDLNALHIKPDLSTEDTRAKNSRVDAVCACGDEEGALYYATKHNLAGENNTPLVIEFDVEKSSLSIDGKDFLYTAFQFSDPIKARPALEACFGSAVLKYADRAWASQIQDFRIAQCDLAIQDPAVIEAHHANKNVIAGRSKTRFRSAFTIKLPVLTTSIVSIYSPSERVTIPRPDINLVDILKS